MAQWVNDLALLLQQLGSGSIPGWGTSRCYGCSHKEGKKEGRGKEGSKERRDGGKRERKKKK